MDSKQYFDSFCSSTRREIEEYDRQWDLGICHCNFRTWLRRREKGEYQFENIVEVVRCSECKYHKDSKMPEMLWCENLGHNVMREFYCAAGDRKEEP